MLPFVLTVALGLAALPAIGADAEVDSVAGPTGWSLYFPVHMPGLELKQKVPGGSDIELDADLIDLAKQANSFFALGVRYDFRALEHAMWVDLSGWHGGYDMDMDDLTAEINGAPPRAIRDLLDVNLDMKQRIVQGEIGAFLIEDWQAFNLGLIGGLRYYDQKIKVFGEIPVWNSECGLFGCFEARPFRVKQNSSWTEVLLGLTATYRWHERNVLMGSFSWGHEDSSRYQLVNTFTFKETWFTSQGWRREEFVNDGVEIVESGLYLDIGKRF